MFIPRRHQPAGGSVFEIGFGTAAYLADAVLFFEKVLVVVVGDRTFGGVVSDPASFGVLCVVSLEVFSHAPAAAFVEPVAVGPGREKLRLQFAFALETHLHTQSVPRRGGVSSKFY
jgi:hypothetical protein